MNNLIESKINEFVRRSSIPQLGISIWRDGDIYESYFGCAKSPDIDVFEIGSIGKTFTATLLAILHRSGVVNLNDSVSKFRQNPLFAKEITLKNLATHTSGLPGNPIKANWFSHSENVDKIRNFKKTDIDVYLTNIKKPLKPGRFSYSNLGMSLLGNILAECVESTYEDAVKKHILLPLGMNDTHVSISSYKKKRLATGHDSKCMPVEGFVWEGMEPAGVWCSTTKDMMLFLKAHLGFSGENWEYLLNNTTRHAFDEPKLKHVGLAWIIQNSDKLGRTVFHNGGTFGQRSVAIISKERNMAVIVLANKIPKLWQLFSPRYSLDKLAEDILVSAID